MKLMERMRRKLRTRHYALATEKSYVQWCIRFVRFHDLRHPATLGSKEVEAFLTHLAVDRQVAASTQNQALAAVLFLYRFVLERPLADIEATRAKRPAKLPVVLSVEETQTLLRNVEGGSLRCPAVKMMKEVAL